MLYYTKSVYLYLFLSACVSFFDSLLLCLSVYLYPPLFLCQRHSGDIGTKNNQNSAQRILISRGCRRLNFLGNAQQVDRPFISNLVDFLFSGYAQIWGQSHKIWVGGILQQNPS